MEDYGNVAGFAGFAGAGEAEDAPVVRYQDLHRSHAPASAGAVEVYGNVPTPPPEFAGDDMEDAGEYAGVKPLPIPTDIPAYGKALLSKEEAASAGKSLLEAFSTAGGFVPSTQSAPAQTVSKPAEDTEGGIDWTKVAIWSGVAVAGVLLTVAVVKAVKKD